MRGLALSAISRQANSRFGQFAFTIIYNRRCATTGRLMLLVAGVCCALTLKPRDTTTTAQTLAIFANMAR
jgi:hypothetical protein